MNVGEDRQNKEKWYKTVFPHLPLKKELKLIT